jgi:hypothetical protein
MQGLTTWVYIVPSVFLWDYRHCSTVLMCSCVYDDSLCPVEGLEVLENSTESAMRQGQDEPKPATIGLGTFEASRKKRKKRKTVGSCQVRV